MSSKSKTEALPRGLHPQARIGIRLFNEGKYYPAHDHLELAWRDVPGEEGLLYKAVLQVGIAYYHIRRGNTRGALKMFRRARRNLDRLPEVLLGIDLAQLQKDANRIEEQTRANRQLEQEAPSSLAFPKLPLKIS